MTAAERIPAPPREVRFAAAFGRPAPLGVLGAVLLLACASIVAVLLAGGAGLPFDDHALDAQHSTAHGEVVRTEATAAHHPRGDVVRVLFRYAVGAERYQATCYAVGDVPATGANHTVEYLGGKPEISRLRGLTRAAPAALPWSVAVLVGGAGFVLLLLWFRAGIARRQLLREGAVAAGDVQRARPVPLVNPPQLSIEFTFRDGERRLHTGRKWCSARGPLGRAILAGGRTVPIVHDPAQPRRCALAGPDDFAAHAG